MALLARLLKLPVSALTYALLALVRGTALLLSATRLGRLIRMVSVPRMQEHRTRTVLTLLGLSLAVGLFVSVMLVNKSIMSGASATIEKVAGKADLQVSGGSSGLDESLLDVVRGTPGVYRSTPVMQQIVPIHGDAARGERLLMLGVDLLGEEDAYFRDYASEELSDIQRDPLAFLNADDNLIVSRKLAERLGHGLNDSIELLTSSGVKPFRIRGFLEDEDVARAFGGAVAIMYYPAMQVAFGRGRSVDRIDIAVEKGRDRAEVARALHARLGDGVSVEPPSARSAQLTKVLGGVTSGLTFGSLIALFVGAFLIQNTMATSIVQRKLEIATLRALGTTRSQILALLSLEGLVLGVVGSALGIGVGFALARGMLADTTRAMDEAYLQLPVTPLSIDPLLLFGAFLAGIAVSVLASALPAWRAARTNPAESMRTSGLMGTSRYERVPSRADFIGLALALASWACLQVPFGGAVPIYAFVASVLQQAAAVALLPRLIQGVQVLAAWIAARRFGVETQLATANLPRDLRRTSMTASALMLCAAMTVTIGVFVTSVSRSIDEWIDHTISGELFVTSGARMNSPSLKNTALDEELGRQLAALPLVERVRYTRVVELPFRGLAIKAVSLNLDAFESRSKLILLEGGSEAEVLARVRAGAVIVSESFSRRFGVHAGQRIALGVKNGTREFDVAGVSVDYTSDIGSVVLDRNTYISGWSDTRVDTYELQLRPNSDVEAVRRTVNERYAAKYDLFVLTSGEYRAELSRLMGQLFELLKVLELVTIIVAIFSVMNTQVTNVLDRVREIGVLRAIGMLRKQTRNMLVAEATLVGLIGCMAGLLLGASGGYIFLEHVNLAQTGWHLPFRYPVPSALEATASILLTCAAAGWLPGRTAANLPVTEALQYE